MAPTAPRRFVRQGLPIRPGLRHTGMPFAAQLDAPHPLPVANTPRCLHRPRAPGGGKTPGGWCRQRLPGLVTQAARKHRLDLVGSWLVGTTLADLEIGRRVGCPSIPLGSGHETLWRHRPVPAPMPVCRIGTRWPTSSWAKRFPRAPSPCHRRAVLPTGGE